MSINEEALKNVLADLKARIVELEAKVKKLEDYVQNDRPDNGRQSGEYP
jgi:cell division protein FtsB